MPSPDPITPYSTSHDTMAELVRAYASAVRTTLLETVWPTRCVVCDHPGTLLCEHCRMHLPYIDYWKTCKRCGGPCGSIQCSECNPVVLKDFGDGELLFDQCVSAVVFDTESKRIVTAYKDHNEQRLARVMADAITSVIPPWWGADDGLTLAYVPASSKAVRLRGFDHAQRLAEEIATLTDLPTKPLFARPRSRDQRLLSRRERIENMRASIVLDAKEVPRAVLLIDDVYTTGATLQAASMQLRHGGVKRVYCATFARVW